MSGLVAVLAAAAAAAPSPTLHEDVGLRGRDVQRDVVELTTPPLTRPRIVSGVARFGYRVTEGSRRWRHGVLVALRIECEDGTTSPYTTRNWRWTAPGAVSRRQPGRDVTLRVRTLLPATGERSVCRLRAHHDYGVRPKAEWGRPSIRLRRGARIRLSGALDAGATEWRDKTPDLELVPPQSTAVLAKTVAIDPAITRMELRTAVELTTCYRDTASCEIAEDETHSGSTALLQHVAVPLDEAGEPCGDELVSEPRRVFIPNRTHHARLGGTFAIDRGIFAGACGGRWSFRVVVTALEGNPVRIHGAAYSNAILVPMLTA